MGFAKEPSKKVITNIEAKTIIHSFFSSVFWFKTYLNVFLINIAIHNRPRIPVNK